MTTFFAEDIHGIEAVVILTLLGGYVIFWIWMMIDCGRFEKDFGVRLGWLLAMIFAGLVAAPAYFILRKEPRMRQRRDSEKPPA